MNQMSLKWKIITNLQYRFNRKHSWRAEQYAKYYQSEKETMITKEHLKHWLGEMTWQVDAILKEVNVNKVVIDGINVGASGESWVSFEYLREKASKIKGLMNCIEWDIEHDDGGD